MITSHLNYGMIYDVNRSKTYTMQPIYKTTLQIVLAFAMVVALAYMNRSRIERHNEKLECRYCQQIHK